MDLLVSIVIPMYNAEDLIPRVLEAIFNQEYDGPVETVVVNDGSRDRSLEKVEAMERDTLKIISQSNQGAVAAINTAVEATSGAIFCCVDADVILERDWLGKILEEFDDPEVGAVQGYIKTPPDSSFLARMAGYDLEHRFDRMRSKYVTQVSTANTAYRREALDAVGPFSPDFVYGYDNDMSYRLQKAGYRLVNRRDAVCLHFWKDDLKGYVRQQYESAFGRMQLIRKHREKVSGDSASGLRMILQVPLTLVFFLLLAAALVLNFSGAFPRSIYLAPLAALGVMFIDRIVFSIGVYRKQKDATVIFMPFLHLLRNTVWTWAFVKWSLGIR